jgi:UDPglucose--hexose-1-phosphate uridylyltransferase
MTGTTRGTTGGTTTTGRVSRTVTRLADGRELIYFDEGRPDSAAAAARPPDSRLLPPARPAVELRNDPLHDEWITVTTHRNTRTFLPDAAECPLCPSRDGRRSEIPADDYDVVVFENRFPSFAATSVTELSPVDDEPLFARRPSAGRCEVVCFSSDHAASLGSLPARRMRTVIEAWADRTAALSALPGVQQVFCFENRGEEIGVTLHHPHGQIYAYPFVPPRTEQVLASLGRAPGLFGEILDAERRAGTRSVRDAEHWTAFVPAAARWPLQLDLYPNRQVADFTELTEDERAELAELYPRLLRACDAYYDDDKPLPYVAGWHQAPRNARDTYRLHLELFSIRRAPGRLKFLAGSESGMGAWINDVAPEQVAERLREVVAVQD